MINLDKVSGSRIRSRDFIYHNHGLLLKNSKKNAPLTMQNVGAIF